MNIVTISPKYQIVIPADIRKMLDLQVGQKLQMIYFEGRIQIVPLLSLEELGGLIPGLDSTVEREEEERV